VKTTYNILHMLIDILFHTIVDRAVQSHACGPEYKCGEKDINVKTNQSSKAEIVVYSPICSNLPML
jgi:membrane-bound inhibitor of C-type lysozyme